MHPTIAQWQETLEGFLENIDYASIATIEGINSSWSTPIYFAWDLQYNFYFISQTTARHIKNLQHNRHVSMAIFNSVQEGDADVVGVQLEGFADILTNKPEEVKKAFTIYFERADTKPDINEYLHNPTWHFVKIQPNRMYYFDTNIANGERIEIPFDELKNTSGAIATI